MNLILQFKKHFRRSTIASGSMLISRKKWKKKKVNKTKNQDNMLCHNKSLYKTQYAMELGKRKH